MKHTTLRATLLLAALACSSLVAHAQTEEERQARWAERPGPVKNEELRRELLQMLKDDQAVRAFQMEGRQPTEAEFNLMRERDEADTNRLSEILDRYGFPGVKLVGLKATRAFVIMLLHSPSVELQKRALPHVERAVRRKEIPPDDFAMLTDDLLAHEGKLQLYGTNFNYVGDKLVIAPSQAPARLDERRRRIGLPPMREYARWLAEVSKKTVDESSLPPAKPRRK